MTADSTDEACKKALAGYLQEAAALQRPSPAPAPAAKASARGRRGAPQHDALHGHSAPDLAPRIQYVGQVDFLFSHIRQTLRVLAPSLLTPMRVFAPSLLPPPALLPALPLLMASAPRPPEVG